MLKIFTALVSFILASCASYDYPETQVVAKKGDPIYGMKVSSIEADQIIFSGRNKPIKLKVGEEMRPGNNRHIVLNSTNPKQNTATFTLSQLDYHDGFLSMPPF